MYKHPTVRQKVKQARRLQAQRAKRFASKISIKGASIVGIAVVLSAGAMSIWLQPAAAVPPPLILGELPYQKLQSQTLTDRSGVLVNVANGNMIVKTQDLTVPSSAGPSLSITRYYNNLSTVSGQVGNHGTLSVGADVNITANSNGSATYQGPSGYQVIFPSNGSGGYTTPASFTAAKLATVSGGGWTLTFNQSGQVYTFNAAGKQIEDANAAGLAITYAYNANGTLASATDAQGKVTTFTNYSGTKVGTITDPAGRTVQYIYDSAGQLTDVTDTNAKTWHFDFWDGHGNLSRIVDPRNYSTTFDYDSIYRVTAIHYNDYLGSKTNWTYTYNSGNTVVADPLTHNTTYTYDANGRTTNVQNGVGDNKGITWDANNNQTATTDSFGHTNTVTFDTLNNPTAVQKPTATGGVTGAKTMTDFTSATKPYLPTKKTDAAGNTIAFSYNVNGSVTTATSASSGGTGMGATTNKYQGDPNGSGGTISCSAKAGQLCTSTDANGNTTSYGYDSSGNVTTVTPPGPVGVQTYTYDSLGRLKTSTDGNGSKVTITYDNADRPTLSSYTTGGSTVGYSYDNAGNLTQRTDAAGTTTYTYDGYNRVTKIQQTSKPDLSYTYDAAGNLKTEAGPFGTVTYSYDNANQVTQVNQPNGANQDFVYTDGKLVTAYLPGNIVQTLTYDNAGRQTGIKAVKNGVTTLTDYSGTYMNAAGTKDTELLQKEINNINTGTYSYSYDGVGRLTNVAGSNGASSWTYSYDNNGNLTQRSKNGVAGSSRGYNAANQQVTFGGAPDGVFDMAGNQTSSGSGLSMLYNPKNQTSSFQWSGQSAVAASYLDSSQTGRTQLGSTAQANGLLGLYSDTTGGTTTYYTHLPTGTGQTVGQTIGGSYYYYLTDLRGSTVKMTDNNGNVVNTYDYDPYGNYINATGSVNNPIRYANGYYDDATSLYKFGARYYNPVDARWTQLDPSGQDKGYLYAGDNPVNFVDPSGLALTNQYLVNAKNNYSIPTSAPLTPGIQRQCEIVVGASLLAGGYYFRALRYADQIFLVAGAADLLGKPCE